jgi:hypothetical protein
MGLRNRPGSILYPAGGEKLVLLDRFFFSKDGDRKNSPMVVDSSLRNWEANCACFAILFFCQINPLKSEVSQVKSNGNCFPADFPTGSSLGFNAGACVTLAGFQTPTMQRFAGASCHDFLVEVPTTRVSSKFNCLLLQKL